MTDKDSTAADQPASSSADKYLRVAVPDHDVGPGGTGDTFLHLGTFPVAGDPAAPSGAEKSLALARAAGAAGRSATGGQLSHTDGNRITTTSGNVVDVIQGSHVAYRSSAHSPPGPTLSCTWAESYYFQVGSEDVPIGSATSTAATDGYPSDTMPHSSPGDTAAGVNIAYQVGFAATPPSSWQASTPYTVGQVIQGSNGSFQQVTTAGKSGTTEPSWPTTVGNTTSDGDTTSSPPTAVTWSCVSSTSANPETASDSTGADTLVQRGDVVSTTWANRMITYVGSAKSPVPYVYGSTYAGTSTYVTSTSGDNVTTTTTTDGGNIVANTWAKGTGQVLSDTKGSNIVSTMEGAAITSTTTAEVITNVSVSGENFSFTFAPLQVAVNIAAEQLSIGIGFTQSIGIGQEVILNLQQNLNAYHDYIFLTGFYTEAYGIKNLLGVTRTAMLLDSSEICEKSFVMAGDTTKLATNASCVSLVYDVICQAAIIGT